MGRLYLVVPAQRFLLDENLSIEDANELEDSGEVEYEYDIAISNAVTDIEYEFEYEEN